MKGLKHITRLAFGAVVGACALTSCQDWLTIYPQTQIVEENFWEDKNDLEGVRYAAYKSMTGTLEKMVLWGDLRSDTYVLSSADESTSTKNFYNELREGRIDRDSANTYFDWSGFYTTINYCNKVLSHGEDVLENDKQFTNSEWRQMRAEMTALRALNYFYLLRSFKDIPYTTKVINNDKETEYFSATNQLVVLDSLITDVESIQNEATNRFSSIKDTKGMMTNSAIYAMLSDMYLWRASLHQGRDIKCDTVMVTNTKNTKKVANLTERDDSIFVVHTIEGDYEMAIKYADKALESLNNQTLLNQQGQTSSEDKLNYGLDYCELYKNEFEDFKSGGGRLKIPGFEKVFSQGNSDESIFELQFNNSDNRSNGVVTSQWGYSNSVHLGISETAIDAIYAGAKKDYDVRTWLYAFSRVKTSGNDSQSGSLPGLYCFKWRNVNIEIPDNGKVTDVKISVNSSNDDSYRNWIIYRMSDVMLQKAEALAILAQFGKKENDPYAQQARRIVNALHRRWYCPDVNNPQVPSQDVSDNDGFAYYSDATKARTSGNIPQASSTEVAVMNERQIEFIAEGKRWFDLVRYAERHAGGKNGTQDPREWSEANPIGNGKAGVDLMVDNFMKNTFSSSLCASLKNHMKNRYGLYNLIYYMEIKASVDENGVQHLEQNPVWNKSLYD